VHGHDANRISIYDFLRSLLLSTSSRQHDGIPLLKFFARDLTSSTAVLPTCLRLISFSSQHTYLSIFRVCSWRIRHALNWLNFPAESKDLVERSSIEWSTMRRMRCSNMRNCVSHYEKREIIVVEFVFPYDERNETRKTTQLLLVVKGWLISRHSKKFTSLHVAIARLEKLLKLWEPVNREICGQSEFFSFLLYRPKYKSSAAMQQHVSRYLQHESQQDLLNVSRISTFDSIIRSFVRSFHQWIYYKNLDQNW